MVHPIHTNKHMHMLAKHLGNFIKKTYNKQAKSGAITRQAGRYGGPLARTTARAITGHGRYKLKAQPRTVYGRGFDHRGTKRPYHKGRGKSNAINLDTGDEFTMTRSEYIGDLITGTGGQLTGTSFTPQCYQNNPGLQGSYPWLSSLAINMQEYSIEKVVYEFRTNTCEASSNGSALISAGQVIMAYSYNAASTSTFNTTAGAGTSQSVPFCPFTNKQQMEQSDGSVSTIPSRSAFLHVEAKHRSNPLDTLYVTGSTTPTQDPRFVFHGIFEIASNGIPVASLSTPFSLGEIWIHYKIRLKKSVLNAGLTNIISSHYQVSGIIGGNNIFSTTPSTNCVAVTNNFQNLVFGANYIEFPINITEGKFLVLYYGTGTAGVQNLGGVPVVTNGSIVQIFNSSAGADDASNLAFAPFTGSTSSTIMMAYLVNVDAPGAALCRLTIGSNTLTTITSAEVFVTQWNSTMSL